MRTQQAASQQPLHAALAVLVVAALLSAGCAHNPKSVVSRGWRIGKQTFNRAAHRLTGTASQKSDDQASPRVSANTGAVAQVSGSSSKRASEPGDRALQREEFDPEAMFRDFIEKRSQETPAASSQQQTNSPHVEANGTQPHQVAPATAGEGTPVIPIDKKGPEAGSNPSRRPSQLDRLRATLKKDTEKTANIPPETNEKTLARARKRITAWMAAARKAAKEGQWLAALRKARLAERLADKVNLIFRPEEQRPSDLRSRLQEKMKHSNSHSAETKDAPGSEVQSGKAKPTVKPLGSRTAKKAPTSQQASSPQQDTDAAVATVPESSPENQQKNAENGTDTEPVTIHPLPAEKADSQNSPSRESVVDLLPAPPETDDSPRSSGWSQDDPPSQSAGQGDSASYETTPKAFQWIDASQQQAAEQTSSTEANSPLPPRGPRKKDEGMRQKDESSADRDSSVILPSSDAENQPPALPEQKSTETKKPKASRQQQQNETPETSGAMMRLKESEIPAPQPASSAETDNPSTPHETASRTLGPIAWKQETRGGEASRSRQLPWGLMIALAAALTCAAVLALKWQWLTQTAAGGHKVKG